MLFPHARGAGQGRTTLLLDTAGDSLPRVTWLGYDAAAGPITGVTGGPAMPLLGEHAHGRFTRPHLRGHRRDGSSWSTRFALVGVDEADDRLTVRAVDEAAGLALLYELESVAGGGLRGRATVTNTGADEYLVDGLEVVLPLPDDHVELLDLTGRHERERTPQRHPLVDGLWLREGRGGRPGLDAATYVVAGTPGFSTTQGRVVGVHVGWSGNSVLRAERSAAEGATIGGGEHLLPGEVVLPAGASYSSPWVYVAASHEGLDGLAAAWHGFQRSLAAHPDHQPVVLNVWEAVYFDHDLDRLKEIADRAARVGVERFVLDDGWFHDRRDDTAGLGDWVVDEEVWPDGLDPLVEHVTGLGMEFGLWFEPEMVNPDSDLFREHPEWVLSAGDRLPLEHRHQQVLDLTRPEVVDHLFGRVDAVLAAHAISFVKWDHNRDLLEAGSGARAGAPAAREQTLAFYELLDRLRAAHPSVAWESCASGGGRVDLGVLERVQRIWTSDMTDALARQQIQRWTTQLVAPEYVGAHVSATRSHTTGRTLSLDFRCATALFGAFGIEWDLTEASDADLSCLAEWVERFKTYRPLLHSGRVVRPESSDPDVLLHGVVSEPLALVAHVQLDESAHNRGVWVRVPGLAGDATYSLTWEGPVADKATSMSVKPYDVGPTRGEPVTGAALARQGYWMPRMRPETVTLVRISRTSA
ncbi:alpha-galactosidase [Nocardioides islandensis]|uniref:Alpha-galactosidase n=1 Tax=Nocardioides islandensis TaxID=433663 RepID=A0A930YEX6_9ACTN|nr:alpha-galactosidase [Nocardioides islandensis]MBF4764292.1 alpha-galactosidase [Nocardioides islandensis]